MRKSRRRLETGGCGTGKHVRYVSIVGLRLDPITHDMWESYGLQRERRSTVILDRSRKSEVKRRKRINVTPWRGVEPRSRAARKMTGACTNPIYYQGHVWQSYWLQCERRSRTTYFFILDLSFKKKIEEKKRLQAPWRGVEPRSRAARRMTGACTNPIYYQGLHFDGNLIYKTYSFRPSMRTRLVLYSDISRSECKRYGYGQQGDGDYQMR